MDATSTRAPDPLAAWLAVTQGAAGEGVPPPAAADEQDPPPARGRRGPRRLLLAAALPWVVAIVLGATSLSRTAPGPAASVAPVAGATVSVTGAAATNEIAPPTPDPALDHRLAAAAVLTLRLSLPAEQYLDTAAAEGVAAVDGATIVTVVAAVLDRVDGQWTGPRHVRFAVPFAADQTEPVALSAPWILPSAARSQATPDFSPVDDADLAAAAGQTLHAAGYRDIAAPQLRRHTALPDILAVHVRARAPGEPGSRDHEIWLDPAASRVLGGPAAPAPAPLPAPVPAEAP